MYSIRSYWNPYQDAIDILKESTSSIFEKHEIQAILEDVNSPVQMRFNQKIYDAVLQKKHIAFDEIEESRGDINAYVGTKNMKETLHVIKTMNEFQRTSVIDYVNTIEEAINNIANLREIYKRGFDKHSEYVMMEYNTIVFTCIEATTSILYEFVDYIKKPGMDSYQIKLKNTKYRANLFFVQQLEKFNNVNRNMLSEYRKFLLSMVDNGGENLTGAMIVGYSAIALVAVTIIPIMREMAYRIINLQRSLSDMCLQQAYFLEMNKSILEANTTLTVEKKMKIIEKQEKIKKQLIVLSERLRVDHVKANEKAKREIDSENRDISVKNIRRELDDSPLQLL